MKNTESLRPINETSLESNQPIQEAEESAKNGGDYISKGKEVIEIFREDQERPINFLKYQGLKMKEYFGIIQPKELDSLLEIDFKQELLDNPPIEGIFSPSEELNKIKRKPRADKRDALEEFKSKLERQRQAQAMCRIFIERKIEANNNVPKDELLAEIERFSFEYGFSENDRKTAEDLIDIYYSRRIKARQLRELYPDDTELVSKLTGADLDKSVKFKVKLGPMSIDVETGHFDTLKLHELRGADNERIKWYSALLGFAGTAAEDNRLFRYYFEAPKEKEYLDDLLKECETEQDAQIREIKLIRLFREVRDWALDLTESEILAMLQNNSIDKIIQDVLYGRIFTSSRNYDFIGEVLDIDSHQDDELWMKHYWEMIQEYKHIIKKAVLYFKDLLAPTVKNKFDEKLDAIIGLSRERDLRGDFTVQEAMALLTDKPINAWPKTIQRILEQKNKDRIADDGRLN